jgi:superfamily I DNA and RNA helicase
VALLQINEDNEAMERLRNALEQQGVDLAPAWEAFGGKGRLVTTSVERIKGLEYDACFVFGMDDVERASLNFTKNRAYVALSRPARRLGILCQEFPQLLTKVDNRLFTETRLG